MIAKGSKVRQKVPAIEGVIDDAKLDTDTGKINYHVTYSTPDGPSARWFAEDELELLADGKVEEQSISKDDVADVAQVLKGKAK